MKILYLEGMRFLLLSMLLFPWMHLSAGGLNTDSLRQVSQHAPDPSDRIFARNKLAFHSRFTDREGAMALLHLSIREAQKNNVPSGEGQACNHLGTIFQELREVDSAEVYHRKALTIFLQTDEPVELGKTLAKLSAVFHFRGEQDSAIFYARTALKKFEPGSKEAAFMHTNLGVYLRADKDYEGAIASYIEALKWFDDNDQGYQAATTRNNIGVLFFHQELYDKAKQYHERALNWGRENREPSTSGGAANGLGNICIVHEDWDGAKVYFEEALGNFKILDLPMEIGMAHANLANVRARQGSPSDAILQYQEALKYLNVIEANDEQVGAYTSLGRQYSALERFDEASSSYHRALGRLRPGTDPEVKLDLYAELSHYFEIKNLPDSALHYQKLHGALKDSLFRIAQTEKIAEVESEFQLEEKDKALESTQEDLDRQSRTSLLLGIGAFLAICLLGYSGLMLRRKQRRHRELQKQQNELRSRFHSLEQTYAEVLSAFEKQKTLQENTGTAEQESSPFPDYLTQLSQRELEVLSYITVGLTDTEIAEKLSVSVATVRTYVRRIFSKLVVRNRSEAANLAFKYGLV